MQVSSASSAQALETANRMRQRMFSRADQDDSGGLSLDEFRSLRPGNSGPRAADSAAGPAATGRVARVFDKLDTNGDGSVSADELEAARPAGGPPGGAFSMGSMSALLSGQEAADTGGVNGAFARLDIDGDGSLSSAEFAAGRAHGAGRHGGHHHAAPPSDATATTDDGAQDPFAPSTSAASGTNPVSGLSELVRKAMQTYLAAAGTQSPETTQANALASL